jgi:hypothetical protein
MMSYARRASTAARPSRAGQLKVEIREGSRPQGLALPLQLTRRHFRQPVGLAVEGCVALDPAAEKGGRY